MFEYKIQSAGSTKIGESHILNGKPCQDIICSASENNIYAIALCDGAGSCEKSELAAQIVSQKAVYYFTSKFDSMYANIKSGKEFQVKDELIFDIQNLLDESKLDKNDGCCTLLVAAISIDGRWMIAHIGDGYIHAMEESEVKVLSYPENGHFINETYYINAENAVNHLRLSHGATSSNKFGFLLTSDGCGDALYNQDLKEPVSAVKTMFNWLELGESDIVNRAIGRALEEHFSTRSDDDLSINMIIATKL